MTTFGGNTIPPIFSGSNSGGLGPSFSISPINVADQVVFAGAVGAGNTSAVLQFDSLPAGGLLTQIESFIFLPDIVTPINGSWHEDEPNPPLAPIYSYRMAALISGAFTSGAPLVFTPLFGIQIRVSALRFGPVGEVNNGTGIFQIRDDTSMNIMAQFQVNLTADTTL